MIKINIDSKNLDRVTRVVKAQAVATEMFEVLNSPEFRKVVEDLSSEWKLGETSGFKELMGWELYALIMAGKEEWNGAEDNEMDLIVDDYTKHNSNVVGYMNPGKPTVWVNTKFFDSMSNKRIGSNFLHEYGHTLGMRHSGPNFKQSLAYFLNHAYETAYDIVFKASKPEIKGQWVCRRSWKTLWITKKCKWKVG